MMNASFWVNCPSLDTFDSLQHFPTCCCLFLWRAFSFKGGYKGMLPLVFAALPLKRCLWLTWLPFWLCIIIVYLYRWRCRRQWEQCRCVWAYKLLLLNWTICITRQWLCPPYFNNDLTSSQPLLPFPHNIVKTFFCKRKKEKCFVKSFKKKNGSRV